MRLITFFSAAAVIVCASTTATSYSPSLRTTAPYEATGQEKQAEVKVSREEADAAMKINKAVGAAAKLQAAGEFLKKYPKSSLRPRIAAALAIEVENVADYAQRIAITDTFLSLFKEPTEVELVGGALLDAYLSLERAEDAFRQAGVWLEKHPDDVDMMRRLSIVSSNEAIRGNNKFVEQGNKYGMRAIELIEADKKPAEWDPARWTAYKSRWLPLLYREAGVLALRTGDKAGAKAKLEKAAALKSVDPAVYAIIGQMNEEEYTSLAARYKSMPAGTEKETLLQTVQNQMDKVIAYYAQAMAVAGDKPEFAQLRSQLMPGLEEYYKFRHNGSLTGLQEMIDKYKVAPATP